YLNVDAAAAIGLLPEKWKPCTKAVGNTSLAGAFQMGKDLWTGKVREKTLDEMRQGVESINLAEQKEFEALYIRYMDLRLS
ncbi:MAG: ASKHA domain-containing protein, partial [Lachnospiraceae bacterium]|nr:ASKHA domain-containing protein [Lachnospiraceae bacterium]